MSQLSLILYLKILVYIDAEKHRKFTGLVDITSTLVLSLGLGNPAFGLRELG